VTRPAPAPERADKWISRAAGATVAGLAGIAGAISYSHMRLLAGGHGAAGWHAHAFPLSVDGVEIVASLVLLADRRSGRRSGWLPWTALTIGTVASLAANIATADNGIVSRVIAGCPAVALLIAVKLLSAVLEHRSAGAVHGTASPGCGNAGGTGNSTARKRPADIRPGSAVAVPGTVPDTPDLIAAARAAGRLHQDGQPLTRDALAARSALSATRSAIPAFTPLPQALRADPAPGRADVSMRPRSRMGWPRLERLDPPPSRPRGPGCIRGPALQLPIG
jgi:hypothetical protein